MSHPDQVSKEPSRVIRARRERDVRRCEKDPGWVSLVYCDYLLWYCPLFCGARFGNEAACRAHMITYHRLIPMDIQRLESVGMVIRRGPRNAGSMN